MPHAPPDLMSFFSILPDPRAANARHPLHNILTIALCAVTGGANFLGSGRSLWAFEAGMV